MIPIKYANDPMPAICLIENLLDNNLSIKNNAKIKPFRYHNVHEQKFSPTKMKFRKQQIKYPGFNPPSSNQPLIVNGRYIADHIR